MINNIPITKVLASALAMLWCYLMPSLDYIAICFFALLIDCYTAWRCNRRIYAKYKPVIDANPHCNIDGRLRSRRLTKAVQDFSVVVLSIFLATALDNGILGHMGELHLANYLAAIYCAVQFVSILENESTCNGAAWARVVQKIVADKTDRHFDFNLVKAWHEANKDEAAESAETFLDSSAPSDAEGSGASGTSVSDNK